MYYNNTLKMQVSPASIAYDFKEQCHPARMREIANLSPPPNYDQPQLAIVILNMVQDR